MQVSLICFALFNVAKNKYNKKKHSWMKNSLLNKPAFRYIFEIIVIVFSVTISFYIQKVLLDREKIELKNIGLMGVIDDLKRDQANFKVFNMRWLIFKNQYS